MSSAFPTDRPSHSGRAGRDLHAGRGRRRAVLRPVVAAAQAQKTIRVAFPVAESGFDPQAIADNYSAMIAQAIFEPLYTYDYFARPAKLVPAAAEALPEVSADLTTYTIRLKK
jgi:ABC-type oligopeptide transport system substrate-binding subunit